MSDVATAIRAKLEREYENEACYGGCGTEDCRCNVTGFDEMKAALLAVVDIHTPSELFYGTGYVCSKCYNGTDVNLPWPCPTVLAIAKGLGVDDA